MNIISTSTKISEIKVGDFFQCKTKEEKNFGKSNYYGHYNYAKVIEVKVWKSGRMNLLVEFIL